MADEIIGWDRSGLAAERGGGGAAAEARSEVAVEKEDLQSPTNRPSLPPSLSSFHAPQLRSSSSLSLSLSLPYSTFVYNKSISAL